MASRLWLEEQWTELRRTVVNEPLTSPKGRSGIAWLLTPTSVRVGRAKRRKAHAGQTIAAEPRIGCHENS